MGFRYNSPLLVYREAMERLSLYAENLTQLQRKEKILDPFLEHETSLSQSRVLRTAKQQQLMMCASSIVISLSYA